MFTTYLTAIGLAVTTWFGSMLVIAPADCGGDTAAPLVGEEDCSPETTTQGPDNGSIYLGGMVTAASSIISSTAGDCPNGVCLQVYEVVVTNLSGRAVTVTGADIVNGQVAPFGGVGVFYVVLSAECGLESSLATIDLKRRRGDVTLKGKYFLQMRCTDCPDE